MNQTDNTRVCRGCRLDTHDLEYYEPLTGGLCERCIDTRQVDEAEGPATQGGFRNMSRELRHRGHVADNAVSVRGREPSGYERRW